VTGPVVVALDEQDQPVDVERWSVLACDALTHEGVGRGELNLLFVSTAAMTDLNREHMGEDGPTDVLSFPIDAGDDSDGSVVGAELLLGDVVVCPEYAAAQAGAHRVDGEHDGTLDDELALLVVHGVLHVLGHDHAEPVEAEAMRARERDLLDTYHRSR
jgi:probable rRNA maturation factor